MSKIFEAIIPFGNKELAPFLSEETLFYHHGKHHVGYANTLNRLIKNTSYSELSLVDIIKSSRGVNVSVFNNAAQLYNHEFYWNCLTSKRSHPVGKLEQLIKEQFLSFDDFLTQYISSATAVFGSGWSWLMADGESLSFLNTSNAENPIGSGKTPVCVIDLWEHAYYIDYRNDRAKYVDSIVTNCINWHFCSGQVD